MANQATSDTPEATIEHERLKSLINNMADGVIALDDTLHVALYNGAALDVLNLNTITSGADIADICQPIDTHNQKIDIRDLILNAKTSITFRDYRLKYVDGSEANLYLSIAPVHLGYGKSGTQGFVILLRDITREKSLEEERDEFISVVSHELRTPITIAEGNLSNALYTARKTGDMTMITKALTEAHDQVIFLADMINDLATLSRAENNKLKADIETINMIGLLKELHDAYQHEAEQKGLTLELELDPKLEVLSSSRLYVHEILQNLITNAIKYTENGSVHVQAQQLQDAVKISVRDSGIGISKSDREKIFDKFFRSEDFRTRQHSGTGLGLYVTMKLLRILDADLDVTSEVNVGSTFIVTFPNLK